MFHSNTKIGWIAAASGLGEVTAAVVSGVVADAIEKKEVMVRVAAVVGTIALAAVAVGVHYEHFALIVAASIASGAAFGCYFPVVEGLFADSVRGNERTAIYSIKFGLERTGLLCANFVTIAVFLGFGDRWEMATMKIVIYAGLAFNAVVNLLLFTIRDEYAVRDHHDGDEHDGITAEAVDDAGTPHAEDGPLKTGDVSRRLAFTDDAGGADCSVPQRHAPLIIAIFDIIVCLGSGMTIMFFPLFLIDSYGVSPIALQLVIAACVGGSVIVAQLLSWASGEGKSGAPVDGLGGIDALNGDVQRGESQPLVAASRAIASSVVNRFRLLLAPTGVDVVLIFFIALATGPVLASAAVVLPVYIVRAASMNSWGGLSRAVMMDLVPKASRAKWNIFNSLSNASLASSAVVGGYIADAYGYRTGFLVTGVFHLTAFATMLPLWRTDDRKAHQARPAM
jgi:MFS family permease